jgi:hypothetical protein
VSTRRVLPAWPLLIIALPGMSAIWTGWVALGTLAGWGVVEPLPGIAPWHLNTAITLPVGVEVYAAFALGAWLTRASVPPKARRFAMWSAAGALALGALAQVTVHILEADHATRAPWPVTILVGTVPVAVIGMAAALYHLMGGTLTPARPAPARPALARPAAQAGPALPDLTPADRATLPPARVATARANLAHLDAWRADPGHLADAAAAYRASVAAGEPMAVRALAREHGISRRQAARVCATVGAEANGHGEDPA